MKKRKIIILMLSLTTILIVGFIFIILRNGDYKSRLESKYKSASDSLVTYSLHTNDEYYIKKNSDGTIDIRPVGNTDYYLREYDPDRFKEYFNAKTPVIEYDDFPFELERTYKVKAIASVACLDGIALSYKYCIHELKSYELYN